MFNVEWTKEAEQDLEAVLAYYVQEVSLQVANSIFSRIKDQVGSLKLFPHRCRPGRMDGAKEYVLHRLPYMAVVHIGIDTVTIINFIPTARKYPVAL